MTSNRFRCVVTPSEPGQKTKAATSELIYQHTQPKRHRLPACITKYILVEQMQSWRETTGVNVFA